MALDYGLPAHLPPLLFSATGKALGLVPWRGVVEWERFSDKGWGSGLMWDGDSGVSVCVEGGVD